MDRNMYASPTGHGGQKHQRENMITLMLLTVVAVFLLCNTLPFITNIFDIILQHTRLLSREAFSGSFILCVELGNLLVCLNSAVYCAIYAKFNAKFAAALRSLCSRRPASNRHRLSVTSQASGTSPGAERRHLLSARPGSTRHPPTPRPSSGAQQMPSATFLLEAPGPGPGPMFTASRSATFL